MTEPTEMELVVGVNGSVRCRYDEALDLRALGGGLIALAPRGRTAKGQLHATDGPVFPGQGCCEQRRRPLFGQAAMGCVVTGRCVTGLKPKSSGRSEREASKPVA